MLEAISNIILSIALLFQFLINSIGALLRLIAHIPKYVLFLTNSVSNLPTIIIPFALASISLGAVLFILGR